MKRILTGLLALVLVALPLTPAVQLPVPIQVAQVAAQPVAGVTYWWFLLRDERGLPLPTTTPATCAIYTAGGDTLATIYSEATLTTAASNPLTAAAVGQAQGNACAFFTANTVTSVDVIAWTKRSRARISGYTANASQGHVIILDQQMTSKILKVPYTNSSGNKTITTFQIPKGAAVRDVFLELITGTVDSHIAVGINAAETGGLDNGFCGNFVTTIGTQASPTATTGGVTTAAGTLPVAVGNWLRCHAAVATVTGAGGWDFYNAAFHSGALMSRGSVGSALYTGAGVLPHAGSYIRFPFIGNGVAKTIVYTTNSKAQTGNIYFVYDELGSDNTNP